MEAVGSDLDRPVRPGRGLTPWGWVAVGLGAVGVVLVVTVFFLGDLAVRERLYSLGFLVLFCAAVLGVVDSIRRRGDRVAVLPTTTSGWWALGMFVVGVGLTVLGSLIPDTTRMGGQTAEGAMLLGFGVALASAVAALVAVLGRRERSLPVIVVCLLSGMFVAFFLLGELALPH